jgi:hypothetical protein
VSLALKLARRFVAAYFNVGDVILWGKWKNKKGKILEIGQDAKGNPTVTIEPIPKGRKKNKTFSLFRIWKMPVEKTAMQTPARRLVARYLQANGIELGRTVNVGEIRIHRYREMYKVTDLTNAGKRGKNVKEMTVTLGYGTSIPPSEYETWFTELGKALVNQTTFDGVRNYLDHVKQEEPYLNWNIRELRGIDVEPTGSKINLKTNNGLEIESSASEFRVLNRWPLTHPETGKSIGYQDTNYYSRDKGSANVFFTWLQKNLSKVNSLDMSGLRNVWNDLNVKYDYQ